jgi:hypothetical protein
MLFKNPTTLGRTPTIEAYKISLCPVCAKPAVFTDDEVVDSGRAVRYRCALGHPWRVSWSGETRQIRRQPWRGSDG